MRKWILRLLLLVLYLSLPFLVLIRISLFTYSKYELNGWLALVLGIAATTGLLLCYAVYFTFKINGKIKLRPDTIRVVIGLVFLYCCYGLVFLSGVNVKNADIKDYYHTLHPILRVTIATVTLANSDLVITDMQRTPNDYTAMGIDPFNHSLHYRQTTGYVHAVDIRTIGQPEWKNRLMQHSLDMLDYNTLRHSGTADHLHIALPLND